MDFLTGILFTQNAYILITALWPVFHMKSFLKITGFKTDVWLVKTVSALLIAISFCGFSYFFINGSYYPIAVLLCTTAGGMISVDFYYVYKKIISKVYLLDGMVEIFFLLSWFFLFMKAE